MKVPQALAHLAGTGVRLDRLPGGAGVKLPAGALDALSEAAFTRLVLGMARRHGWRTFHARPARTAKGWRTPVSGDGKGFVDLLLCRERVVAAELKTAKGRVRPEQRAWLDCLTAAGVECHVWRPADLGRIEELLGG